MHFTRESRLLCQYSDFLILALQKESKYNKLLILLGDAKLLTLSRLMAFILPEDKGGMPPVGQICENIIRYIDQILLTQLPTAQQRRGVLKMIRQAVGPAAASLDR